MESLRGKLLIAGPTLLDPNFQRTVVLVTEHTDDGAMGLVLNRPARTPVTEIVPSLAELVEPDSLVFLGGPVQPSAAVVLAEFSDPARAPLLVLGNVGFVTDGAALDAGELGTLRARVFAGYAGWSAGQLEAEVDAEDWIIGPAEPEDPFDDEPGDLWRRALERKGGRYALLGRMPPDPSLN